MLWQVQFDDQTNGFLAVETGRLFTVDGDPVDGGVCYSTVDTAPAVPGWYQPPDAVAVTVDEAPTAPADLRITHYAFMSRMTAEERINVRVASQSSPALADTMEMMQAAAWISLDDPLTVGGIGLLEHLGLIGVGRANEIISAPVRDVERPNA